MVTFKFYLASFRLPVRLDLYARRTLGLAPEEGAKVESAFVGAPGCRISLHLAEGPRRLARQTSDFANVRIVGALFALFWRNTNQQHQTRQGSPAHPPGLFFLST